MLSQVTLWVEHGESTDPLETFIMLAQGLEDTDDHGFIVVASDFIVDVPSPVVVAKTLHDGLLSLSWEERANIESGKPLD
jgi:hypothetical protein